ncbi:uncharacterized protein UV8b_06339 [Ustilaginoidea virens]|uniref:CBS domain-containing protein n=1 Tax=Ustilaginoidea virens TaxID=1159556 RepID=A0A1B5LAM6_USTVR|nr:uncharacterized protein UV8b_06339 [Ustilaginoidea virens]QUC22098.1 hypothetical protein UV8b_06339 [Ustilaginoidea virens]GAO20079.1 hypothetical protein UVI_02022370 [Ustilaginoidea virens]
MDPTSNPQDERNADPVSVKQTGSKPASSDCSSRGNVPQMTPSLCNVYKPAQRQNFAENFRNIPQSPRHLHATFPQAAVQDLISHPPSRQRYMNPKLAGREWGEITVDELISTDDVKWVQMDSSVEEATMVLLKSKTNVVLIRENDTSYTALSTFDYSDLNAYLLVVIGLCKPEPDQAQLCNDIMLQARDGKQISLRQFQPLCKQEPLVGVPSSGKLSQAIEILGSGIHRLLVIDPLGDVLGIISQLRMVDFFWNEGVNFPVVDCLYSATLQDLGIGAQEVISVNSDDSLSDALTLMNNEGLTSVAVVDGGHNVVGNISTKDVRHLTTTSNAPLLNESCMRFLSVILNERGVEKGRDAFPVFYVTRSSTLAHVVGKLTATRAHRLWIVDPKTQSPSGPATPMAMIQNVVSGSMSPTTALPGACISGKPNGVVSLTDVLNIFAKFAGLHPTDPGEQRAQRRRSSSSSVRPSLDSSRPSIDFRRT